MGLVLPHEDLSSVGLATQVDSLGVDLVRDVDQEYVEEVVRDMVRLEYYLDAVLFISWYGTLTRDEYKWYLFMAILDTFDKGFKIEIDRE